jgi:DNA polymerase V
VHGDVVVAEIDNDFTVKYLHRRGGRVKLVAADPTFPEIVPHEGQTLAICGVVTATIKRFR